MLKSEGKLGEEKLLWGGVIQLRQEGAVKCAYLNESRCASARVGGPEESSAAGLRPNPGRTPSPPCLRTVLAPSPLALTAVKLPPPAKAGWQQCARAHSSKALGEGGEAPAGSVTSRSPLAVPIRGRGDLPGVSDRALYAVFSATFWCSASCYRP